MKNETKKNDKTSREKAIQSRREQNTQQELAQVSSKRRLSPLKRKAKQTAHNHMKQALLYGMLGS